MNRKILTISLSLIIVALVAYIFINQPKANANDFTKEAAVNKALNYINNNLVPASLAQIYESNENASYYTFQITVTGQKYDIAVTADGSRLFMDAGIDLNKEVNPKVDGGFSEVLNPEITTEDGKPVIYMFTSSTCPHCEWEKPIIREVIAQFGDNVILKEREDTDEDQNIYTQFGTGGVPLIVLGGKYYREGSGENFGEEQEKAYLTKHICDLTGGLPESVCQK